MKTLLHLSPLAVVGGCEVNCLRLIKGLPGYRHRVLVFDDVGPMTAEWEEHGAEVFHLHAWLAGRTRFQAAFQQWMWTQEEPDGIFYWSSSRLPDVLDILGKWEAPVIVHLGNPLPEGKWLQVARRLWEDQRRVVRRDTALAACSERVALSHRGASFFRRYPIEVIYNPVEDLAGDGHRYRGLAREEKAAIGMVGRLDSIKDHLTIVRAAATLAQRWPGLVVEFAGDGALRRMLEQEAANLGVAERVRFLGFVQVRSRLVEWDVYVHSTTASEGMGTAVAEAMVDGLPCIVSDLPVMREVCGETAAYFAPGNAAGLAAGLDVLLADRAQRERLGTAARLRAQRMFSMEQAATAYERLLFQTARQKETV